MVCNYMKSHRSKFISLYFKPECQVYSINTCLRSLHCLEESCCACINAFLTENAIILVETPWKVPNMVHISSLYQRTLKKQCQTEMDCGV